MKNFVLTLLAITAFALTANCQKETDNWFFGVFAGINFGSGSPAALPMGMLYTTEGCSSISDTAGNLIFYTDGMNIWDHTGTLMPNGIGLMGDVSTTQSALIVRQPLSYNIYYVFTLDDWAGPDGFRYSVVDMTLNGGMGDVVPGQKNILLQDHVVEKMCAVNAANDTNVWVMVHGWGDNAFYAYQLTPAGIPGSPMISHTGSVHDSIASVSSPIPQQNTVGYMKFSPDGHKLALAKGYQNEAELFDFNNLTGEITNPMLIPLGEHTYGVEFSPKSTKLYLNHYDNFTAVYKLEQFDLLQTTPAAILASETLLFSSIDPAELRAMQLGKDKRIYISKNNEGFMGVIYYPDSAGIGAQYHDNDLSLAGNTCALGLPNFNASYFRELVPPVAAFAASDSTICINGCVSFTDSSQYNPSTWQWTFPGGTPSTSTLQNPTVCYSAPGNYFVTLVVTNSKGSDTLTQPTLITVFTTPPVPVITVSGSDLNSTAAAGYQWYYNNGVIAGATSQTYTPTATGDYMVVVTDANGCQASSLVQHFVFTNTGVANLSEGPVRVYPNPVKDFVTFELPALQSNTTVIIRNALGEKVATQEFDPSGQLTIDLRHLPSGIYTAELNNNTGKRILKLIKQ